MALPGKLNLVFTISVHGRQSLKSEAKVCERNLAGKDESHYFGLMTHLSFSAGTRAYPEQMV